MQAWIDMCSLESQPSCININMCHHIYSFASPNWILFYLRNNPHKRFSPRNKLPSCSHSAFHQFLFVKTSDAALNCQNNTFKEANVTAVQGFQLSLAAFLVLYASQHSRSSCGGHSRSKGLSHLLSRGSSASYGPGSRKLSYRGKPCQGPLDARGAGCSLGSHQIVPEQCSTVGQPLRPPSVRTSCIWKKERINKGNGRF